MDLRYRRIPHIFIYLLFFVGLYYHLYTGLPWEQVAIFFAVNMLGKMLEHCSPGRIGWGDIKLIATLALTLSVQSWYLLTATALGCALAYATVKWFLQKSDDPLPFAPFLCIAALYLPVIAS